MEVKVNIEDGLEKVKRLYCDVNLTISCPNCDKKLNYSGDYFSHVEIGYTDYMIFVCSDCEDRFLEDHKTTYEFRIPFVAEKAELFIRVDMDNIQEC